MVGVKISISIVDTRLNCLYLIELEMVGVKISI
jgi:hypothetical protein